MKDFGWEFLNFAIMGWSQLVRVLPCYVQHPCKISLEMKFLSMNIKQAPLYWFIHVVSFLFKLMKCCLKWLHVLFWSIILSWSVCQQALKLRNVAVFFAIGRGFWKYCNLFIWVPYFRLQVGLMSLSELINWKLHWWNDWSWKYFRRIYNHWMV